MPRMRYIKPEFWKVTHDISEGAALLFIGLWNFSDDFGVVELDPEFIKANIFPKRNISIREIIDRLNELHATDRVLPYKFRGILYGWIPAFKEHQIINKPSKTKFPDPPQTMVEEWEGRRQDDCYEFSDYSDTTTGVLQHYSNTTHTLMSEECPAGVGRGVGVGGGVGNRSEELGVGSRSGDMEKPVAPDTGATRTEKKDKFLDHVYMTKGEKEKLIGKFGEQLTDIYIEKLNAYIGSKGKKYKSHYLTIRGWMVSDEAEGKLHGKASTNFGDGQTVLFDVE